MIIDFYWWYQWSIFIDCCRLVILMTQTPPPPPVNAWVSSSWFQILWRCHQTRNFGLHFYTRKKSRELNKPLNLVCFVFPIEVPGELDPLSFLKLCLDMHVNKTKFERNSSLEYYHMTCIGKTKHTSLRGPLFKNDLDEGRWKDVERHISDWYCATLWCSVN